MESLPRFIGYVSTACPGKHQSVWRQSITTSANIGTGKICI